jgi:hypothetical protein
MPIRKNDRIRRTFQLPLSLSPRRIAHSAVHYSAFRHSASRFHYSGNAQIATVATVAEAMKVLFE